MPNADKLLPILDYNGNWRHSEIDELAAAVMVHGSDYDALEKVMTSRNRDQIKRKVKKIRRSL